MSSRRYVVAAALAALIAAAGFQPSPAAAVGYAGNWCADNGRWFVDNGVGSEACMQRNSAVSGRSIKLTPGAFDYKRDGKSAVHQWRVQQYYSSAWRITNSGQCRNARGKGTTEVCAAISVARKKNSSGQYIASRVALQMRSCSYDGDRGLYSSCTSWENKFNSSWNF